MLCATLHIFNISICVSNCVQHRQMSKTIFQARLPGWGGGGRELTEIVCNTTRVYSGA
jgi:hypothetical protein